MTITTMTGLKSARRQIVNSYKFAALTGVIGTFGTFWTSGAGPGSQPANTTTGVVPTSSTAGAIPFNDPAAGDVTLLASAKLNLPYSNATEVTFFLCDRLWHAGPFTPFSGAYAGLVGAALTRSTDAVGVELYVEITTALSAAAHTLTITYTNQAGATGHTATVTLPGSALVNNMYPVALQSGDTGIARITGMSGSASPPTGAFGLVLAKVHATIEVSLRKGMSGVCPQAYHRLGASPIPNSACLFWYAISGVGSVPQFSVALELAHG